MRALFDVNFLTALFLPSHIFHEISVKWFAQNQQFGWSSCAITENGAVRVFSQPALGSDLNCAGAIAKLADSIQRTDHAFWPVSVSLTDESVFDHRFILGPKQITDTYLLGLAAHHRGRLVTFDRGIVMPSVRNATSDNLVVL
jgi:toxin-antitoxin system PIN domain toxin